MTLPFIAVLILLLAAPEAQRRESNIATEKIFQAIGLREGMTVCEMGAGDGELTVAAARIAGAAGRVYSSELGADRVKGLRAKAEASGVTNITVVEGDPVRTNFPEAGCDALFLRNVYHHFADPPAINRAILASMKPGGRVAVVDFVPRGKEAASARERGNEGSHGVTPETVTRELRESGFETASSERGEDGWFMVVAARPGR